MKIIRNRLWFAKSMSLRQPMALIRESSCRGIMSRPAEATYLICDTIIKCTITNLDHCNIKPLSFHFSIMKCDPITIKGSNIVMNLNLKIVNHKDSRSGISVVVVVVVVVEEANRDNISITGLLSSPDIIGEGKK